MTRTHTYESLRDEYMRLEDLDAADRLDGKLPTALDTAKQEYEKLRRQYPERYPELPELLPGEMPPDEVFKPFVGTYEFKYMRPNLEYVFVVVPPTNHETGREIYKPTPLVISDKPTDLRYDNDAQYNG